MNFDDGSELVVPPVENMSGEDWRLFQPGTKQEHFVVPPAS